MGNPPYSVSTSNKGDWIVGLCADYKKDLNEKNIQPLSDDYVKFIRLGQHVIDRTGAGVLGYIINNSFIDGIIHRRMRQHLIGSFNRMHVLDLHGSTKKKETALDGSKDENVFDIMQGVNINLYAKTGAIDQTSVQHFSLQGLRMSKYEKLLSTPLSLFPWTGLVPTKPDWVLTPKDTTLSSEYGQGFALNNLFEINSSGVKTHRDDFVVDFDKNQLEARIRRFYDQSIKDEKIAEEFGLKNNRDWSIPEARIGRLQSEKLSVINYRPFDARPIYYDQSLIDFDKHAVMQHMIGNKNGPSSFSVEYNIHNWRQ
jgi:predicted helicase